MTHNFGDSSDDKANCFILAFLAVVDNIRHIFF